MNKLKDFFKSIKQCYSYIPYTFKHWIFYIKEEKALYHKVTHILHDWDKLFMYALIPFVGKYRINAWHQKWSKHHPTYWKKSKDGWVQYNKNPLNVDWKGVIADWNCAPKTKLDKPLYARDTMEKYYPNFRRFIEPILDILGL